MKRKNPYYELNFMLYRILLQYFVPLALIIVEITAFIYTERNLKTHLNCYAHGT